MSLMSKFNVVTGNATANYVSEAQWTAYVNLCNSRRVDMRDRASFNKASISEEIKKLLAMRPVVDPTENQLKLIAELWSQYVFDKKLDEAMKAPAPKTNIEASEVIERLCSKVTPLESTLKKLDDYYRFSVVEEEQVLMLKTEAEARELVASKKDAYKALTSGRSTYNQALMIVSLQDKLLRSEAERISWHGTSSLLFEEASELIQKLKIEADAVKSAYMVAKTVVTELPHAECTIDDERFASLSFEEQEAELVKQLFCQLRRACGMSTEDIDSINIASELGNMMAIAVDLVGKDREEGEKIVASIVADVEDKIASLGKTQKCS